MNHTVVTVLPKVRLATSGATHSHGVTGGVYKARERIHRGILIRDYCLVGLGLLDELSDQHQSPTLLQVEALSRESV